MQSANAYRDADILTASPGRLLVLTYDALLAALTRLRAGVSLGKTDVATAASDQARAILCELLVTLDREAGGALAQQLAGLYAFLLTELDRAALRRDTARLDRVIEMVRELRDAFAQAAATTGSAGVARSAVA